MALAMGVLNVDENADVRPGIIKLTASGYAVAPALAPVQLGFQPGRLPNDI